MGHQGVWVRRSGEGKDNIFNLEKTIEISYSGIFHVVFEPQKLLQVFQTSNFFKENTLQKPQTDVLWFASFSSSERPCLAYRNHHFIGQRWWDRGNFMWFKLIEMLQDTFLSISTSTGSLTTHFKSKEPQSLHWIHCPFPFVNVKQTCSPGSDGGFAVITRTRWKDKHRLHCGTWAGVLRIVPGTNRENVCVSAAVISFPPATIFRKSCC